MDDEPFVRRGIRGAVNWNELGIEMVAEASDGVEALAQFVQDRPDIILLDINMPRMDGLEFASIAKRESPSTRIVIITGYNDFEFVRTALRIGIDDYILKPMTRESVQNIILAQLEALRENPVSSSDGTSEAEEAKRDSERLNGVLRREPRHTEMLREFCDEHGLQTDSDVRFVVLREYVSGHAEWADSDPVDLAQFAVLNIANERISQVEGGIAFTTYRNETALLLTCKDSEIAVFLDDLRNGIMDLIELPVYIGVSERGPISELPRLADHAREALGCGFVLYDEPFITYEAVSERKKEVRPYPSQLEADLLDRIFGEEPSITLERIDALFEALSDATIDVRQSRQYLNRFLVTLARTIESISAWAEVPVDAAVSEIADSAQIGAAEDFKTLDEARLWMRGYFKRSYEYVRSVVSRSGQLFLTIKAYIEKNYMHSDLNLKKCSEELYLSSSYISSTLRKEAGKSFVDFLSEYRISQATRLLRRPGARISEVSEQVGFTHPTYFSTVFRKMTGMTPTQYRASLPVAADDTTDA